MDENYVYPVIVSEEDEEGVFKLTFPDFENGSTCAYSKEDIIATAQDFLAMTILDYEGKNMSLPEPSLNLTGALYVHLWLPYFRGQIKEVYMKKTLTLPTWLELLGRRNNVNFSAALVRGLKEELHIK